MPYALKRLVKQSKSRNFDLSKIGYGSDVQRSDATNKESIIHLLNDIKVSKTSDNHIRVNQLSLQYFRAKLIRHSNITFQNKEVVWPKSNRVNK